MSDLKRTYSITVKADLALKIEQFIGAGNAPNFSELFRKAIKKYMKEFEMGK